MKKWNLANNCYQGFHNVCQCLTGYTVKKTDIMKAVQVSGSEQCQRGWKNKVNWVTGIPVAIALAVMVLTSLRTHYKKAVN